MHDHSNSGAYGEPRSLVWALVAVLCFAGAARAEDTNLKDGAKKAGHSAGSVVREIGQGAKRAGKAIGSAAKEGGKEFRRAIRGQSD